jgi:hypothetical protein
LSQLILTNSTLTIPGGLLTYRPGYSYQFYIKAWYKGATFTNMLTIDIANILAVPIVTLGCRFNCIKFPAYQVLNPSSDLIIDATCLSGCINGTTSFAFNIYFNSGNVRSYLNFTSL